jgi:phospholipid/cholesterol/gamma-HCH transport system substrate-binding protein
MEKTTGKSIKLGVFVATGILIFIIAIYNLGARNQLFNSTFKIHCLFKDANGLKAGNNVRFGGVAIGTVDKVQIISDTLVKVDMMIDKSVRKFLRDGVKATVGSEGLMGDKLINISHGQIGEKEIKNNDTIEAGESTNIDEILLNLEVASFNAAEITGNLDTMLEDIRSGKGIVGKLFTDTSFANNVGATINNIKEGTEAAKHSFLLRGYFKDKEKEKGKDKKKKGE